MLVGVLLGIFVFLGIGLACHFAISRREGA
jgi:hypothetical protein